MLLLGACHLLLWSGDIVFFYALLGFVLLPLRKFSNKALLISGGILILSPILLYGLKLAFPVLNFPSELLSYTGMQVSSAVSHIKSEGEWFNLMKNGSWWEIVKLNVGGFFFRYGDLFFISRISKVLGMFLVGYVIGRSDFYKNIAQYKKIIYGVIAYGLLIAIPANYILAHYMMWYSMDYYSLKINGLYQTIAYAFGVAPLALSYVGVLMLCCQTAVGKKILTVFAPVGKMAFSNYIFTNPGWKFCISWARTRIYATGRSGLFHHF